MVTEIWGSVASGPTDGGASPLTWAPPDTTGWTTHNIPTGTSRYSTPVSAGTSYVFVMPNAVRGSVRIRDCANFVIIGGHIDVTPDLGLGDGGRRALEIQNVSGSGFVEGLEIAHTIGSSTDRQGDAVYITGCSAATITIQNCRVPMVWGQNADDGNSAGQGDHGDVGQVFASSGNGVHTLRIGRFSYVTNYQGIPAIFDGSANVLDIRDVDGEYDNALATSVSDHTGGIMAAFGAEPGSAAFTGYVLREVRDNMTATGVVLGGPTGSWTDGINDGSVFTHSWVNGGTGAMFTVDLDAPENVPDGAAGLDYVSPGYL